MKKGFVVLAIVLWVLFLGCLAGILYLSFQDGESAKEIGSDIIDSAARWYYGTENIAPDILLDFTYKCRQIGRIVLFTLFGIIGTSTIHATFYKLHWVFRTLIAITLLILVAVFTERYKIYLPTRHFSEREMLYSIYGVLIGFGIVSVITSIYTFARYLSGRSDDTKLSA